MMNNHQQQNDIYYDPQPSRSPASNRHQQQMLQQPSRPYDAYGAMPNNLYAPDEQALRYESNRFDRMNGQVPNMGYGYDPQQTQTWNPNAFSSSNNNNNFTPYAATGRMKSQTRGRSTLPTVSHDVVFSLMVCSLTLIIRPGSTSRQCLLPTHSVALVLLP